MYTARFTKISDDASGGVVPGESSSLEHEETATKDTALKNKKTFFILNFIKFYGAKYILFNYNAQFILKM